MARTFALSHAAQLMNKYYCAGKTGSDFFEKAREKIKNTRH